MRKSLVALMCITGLLLAACSSPPPAAAPITPASELGATAAILASGSATNAEQDITITGTIGFDEGATKYVMRRGGPKSEAVVGEGASQFTVVGVPGFIFVKAPAVIWEDLLTPEQAERIDNKWVVSNAEGPLKDFSKFIDVSTFFRASGNVTKGKTETVDGEEAVTIIDPPTSTDSKWWIAAEGTPLLFKMKTGKYTRVAFDYDQTNIVDLPAEKDVTDFTLVLEDRLDSSASPTPTPKATQ
jgi:hypothetical protein